MVNEISLKTGKISVMKDSRQVLVKIAFFQLREYGHPQDNATPSFFPDSKSFIYGLSNEVSFVSDFL